EDNVITQQKDDELSKSSDLFELDVEEFQQIFDQKPLKDDNFLCTTYDYISEIIDMYNNDLLISETFELTPRKLVQPCSYKNILLEQNQALIIPSSHSKGKLKDSFIRKPDEFLVKDNSISTFQEIKIQRQLLQHDKVIEELIP